jgi:hypothetical protein
MAVAAAAAVDGCSALLRALRLSNLAQVRLVARRDDHEKSVRECGLSRDDCAVLLALILVKVYRAGIRITCKIQLMRSSFVLAR